MKTKKNLLVTIIITNFNKSKYLVKAIKSCVNQKYQKIEIIFFDDKSTDDSLKRLKDFKIKNKVNLKIITNNKKIQKTAPINQMIGIKKGLSKAKGKFIFFLDSDDFFHKNKIYEIMNIFFRNKKIKLIFDQPIYKYKSKEIKKNYYVKKVKNIWPKFPPTSCMSFETKTLKKVINKINFERYPNLAIDFYLAVYYSIILNNFYIHNSHLTYYRQLSDGTDSRYIKYKSKFWWIRRGEAFEFLNKLLIKNKLPKNQGVDYYLTMVLNKFLK